jgi:hypothetical protein
MKSRIAKKCKNQILFVFRCLFDSGVMERFKYENGIYVWIKCESETCLIAECKYETNQYKIIQVINICKHISSWQLQASENCT